MMNPTVKSMLLANIDVDEYNPLYRKTMLLNLILMATAIGFGVFSVVNFLVLPSPVVAFFDFFSFLLTLYAIYHIRKSKTIERASLIASGNILVFLLILIYFRHGESFTFIWTIFVPLTVILVNGSRRGLYLSLLFYGIVFTYTYTGIDIWQDGKWQIDSYSRFVGASLLLVYIVYLFEQSSEKAFLVLNKIRKKEKEYVNQLETCSITDPLTELYNRRQLEYLFDKNFAKAEFYKSYFAFFILDVDDFKLFNDTYGHIKGDEVLMTLANTLKNNMKREGDNVFRLGGEEFCGLIMANSSEKIFKSIENIRSDIEALAITHENSRHKVVTVSFGVCIVKKYQVKSFDAMYKIADKYLYEAKKTNKNCIHGSVVTLKDG